MHRNPEESKQLFRQGQGFDGREASHDTSSNVLTYVVNVERGDSIFVFSSVLYIRP